MQSGIVLPGAVVSLMDVLRRVFGAPDPDVVERADTQPAVTEEEPFEPGPPVRNPAAIGGIVRDPHKIYLA